MLPKALGRALAIAGAGDTLTARALGETLGAETVTLTSNEMPAHTHTIGTHPSDGGTVASVQNSDQPAAANSLITGSTGSGAAHANMQPSVFLNAMVKL